MKKKMTTMETLRCQFWLPKKKRSCANTPLNDSMFCGNHNPKLEDQRIPCPLDPSHFILKENLETHITKCPLLKQTQSLILQPFYKKGINGGTDDDEEEEQQQQHNVTLGKPQNVVAILNKSDIITSEMKRNAVHSMTITNFSELIRKIVAVHGSICSDIQDSYKIPKACDIWINREVDRKIPFQEKHVLQQASILGNLEDIGVLLKCPTKNVVSTQVLVEHLSSNASHSDFNGISAVVEFGAGRGYLTQTLADCYGINKVILVERKSYKLKADRSLRQKESLILERLRIDIEDLNLNAVDSLKGVPYLAIGKHLCGPATDLTLRCCVPKRHIQDNAVNSSGTSNLRGLAIATCCHHLCQWKQYINKSYLTNLGFTKDDFHVLTWFTSWAVDADHGSEISDMVDQGSCLNSIKKKDGSMDASGIEEVVRNMPSVERAVLGFMCKAIIDMGRLMWIKECGLEAELVKYVPSSISPENNLLVAK